MVKKFYIVFAVMLILIVLLLFVFNTGGINNLSPNEFEELILSEEVFLINTHTPYQGEIDGTDLIAENWENMESYADLLPSDKNIPVAVYCRSGRMSSYAAEQLSDMGYKNIYNLEGGMNAWESGGKIIKNEK